MCVFPTSTDRALKLCPVEYEGAHPVLTGSAGQETNMGISTNLQRESIKKIEKTMLIPKKHIILCCMFTFVGMEDTYVCSGIKRLSITAVPSRAYKICCLGKIVFLSVYLKNHEPFYSCSRWKFND